MFWRGETPQLAWPFNQCDSGNSADHSHTRLLQYKTPFQFNYFSPRRGDKGRLTAG